MAPDATPILWITGPPAAGKSVAAWAIFRRLAADGVRAAYLDIDQVGMLYPSPPGDPDAHRLKASALRALVPGYRAHGARAVIVSGVVDASAGPRADLPEGMDLTVVALTPDDPTLDDRLRDRGWTPDDIDAARAERTALRHATFLDDRIETSGMSIDDTVDRLIEHVVSTGNDRVEPAQPTASDATLPVVAITGPRAVGTSTVGYGFAARQWHAGLPTAYVDPAQLSFLSGGVDPTDDALARRQLAAMHTYLADHAGLLVVGGRPTVAGSLRTWAPRAPHLLLRLRTDRATLEGHVRERARGGGARLAGDDLDGADPGHLAEVVASSIAQQEILDQHGPAEERKLDIVGRSADELIDDVEHLVAQEGW